GNEHFTDVAREQGVASVTRFLSGWGLKFFDFDNDGALDLMVANGHPDDVVDLTKRGVRYREPLLLFHREGAKLRSLGAEAGAAFARDHAARGLAVGDFDNDGRLDVLVGVNGGSPLLLRNVSAAGNNWVGLQLVPDAIGARVTWSAGGVKQSRFKAGGGSYLSSHDPRMVLGLGKAAKCDWVEVEWPGPSGYTQRVVNPGINRYHALKRR
ncbi:MAG: CRTAC1 family protein, partial [Bryobacteraceae bacterium]